MIYDLQSLFSDGQAIRATAASTNVVDLGPVGTPIGSVGALPRDIGAGAPTPISIRVNKTFNTLTSLRIDLQVSDVEAFTGTPDTVSSITLTRAQLVAGRDIPPQYIPRGTNKRYVRLTYTVVGNNPTAGEITAGFVCGLQTNGA